MSFPGTPDININFEEAVDFLLISIALEGISISKLIDAETRKVLKAFCGGDFALNDALAINKSVEGIMQKLAKLQMLLQFKLEKARELIPCSKLPAASTGLSCQKGGCKCFLIGKGDGSVANKCDKYHDRPAYLKAFVTAGDIAGRKVHYTVEGHDEKYEFYSSGCNVNINCRCEKTVIYGIGRIDRKEKCGKEKRAPARFNLVACEAPCGGLEFKMEIKAGRDSPLNHDSGTVIINDFGSILNI